MSNFLSIEDAIQRSGVQAEDFEQNYIETGKISIQVNDGIKQIELSEFFRVFPQSQNSWHDSNQNLELELALKNLKIENLEYQVANLQRQLGKQDDEYNWLRNKFDNTTLLLEQKLDTSEVDKYKQEIRLLSHQAIQWEKKYNTLLAATELKSLSRENRELKEQLLHAQAQKAEDTPQSPLKSPMPNDSEHEKLHLEKLKAEVFRLQQLQTLENASRNTINHTEQTDDSQSKTKPPRHKIFGIF